MMTDRSKTMAIKGLSAKQRRNARRSPKDFAERLAMIVLRWRTVYVQQPHADTGLWMSRSRNGTAGAQSSTETK
jgi:hypothetical protein